MAVDKRRNRRGQGITGKIKASQNFRRDILRGILSPMFGGVERDGSNRVTVLTGHQIADDGFEVGLIDIGFRKCVPKFPKLLMTR
jgi:hypothetical protein